MNWSDVVGLKVVALRGWNRNAKYKRGKEAPLCYVLFDDGKSWLELTEQDYFSYHDCSSSARHLELYSDPARWQEMFDCKGNYAEAATFDF